MATGTTAGDNFVKYGPRALRTRQAILTVAGGLFLERGYAGTRISNITSACGISRAGFYTYFRDKRELFGLLAENAYGAILDVISTWDTLPRPCAVDDVAAWVRAYFTFMDTHGAFIFASSQSWPDDPRLRAASTRRQLRVAHLLGAHLRGRQADPTGAPEALGLAALAMLDRSWYRCHTDGLPVHDEDVVGTIARLIRGLLAGTGSPQAK
ncbi:TetR/AcrR family transcriptional regulator [Amycolatopsis thermoflava]|uniref:TetR/AcrR family transcriptional regulator n=1 Tax=Amycolatopsis thermoflava TaxID=84480 RepID=UPI00381C1957